MRLSQLAGERFKEKPADATVISQIFLLRGGYIKHLTTGSYSLLPPARRIAAKIERILREEMDAVGGQEVLLPAVLPRELWDESGRYTSVGSELLRMKDRGGRELLFAMTHEEAAVALVRDDLTSYGRYPVMIYQIQTKFRDEPRCRGGLIRVREFTMKDGYSFHTSQEDLAVYYEKCKAAYHRIFARIGIPESVSVGSDTGMMGGSAAHEFMLLCDAGEDSIAVCPTCGFMDNVEVAESVLKNPAGEPRGLTEIATPDVSEIDALVEFTGEKPENMIKACVFAAEGSEKAVVVFIRADREVNEAKLKKVLKANVYPYDKDDDGLVKGFIGPVGLNGAGLEVLFDESVKGLQNAVCGANRKDTHYQNACCGRDFTPAAYHGLYKVKDGDACPECGGAIEIKKGIEVGNIFQLGTKYTKSMNMTYADESGERRHPVMGCYGIGVGRAIAAVAEARHDEYGPIWPFSIAPWHVHINLLNGSGEMRAAAERLYASLLGGGYEVLFDDRGVSAGVQFSDADLLGIPYRVVFGGRNFDAGLVEITARDKSFKTLAPKDNVLQELCALLDAEKAKCKASSGQT
jgi:prolyl-tRNA synthetase